MPDDPIQTPVRARRVETLPTVVLEHARTGQPIVVDLRDYLAGKDGRYADWRLFGQGRFIDPPPLKSEGGPPDPERPDPESPEPDDIEPEDLKPSTGVPGTGPPAPRRRRRRKHRRSLS
ncbi:hypothetical protein [Thalassobaculum sp.]|uniref:hypothetical protein n=1 Tax=Thalassobaculum sp. TaxID=2022740 RepID=UPI0032EB6571